MCLMVGGRGLFRSFGDQGLEALPLCGGDAEVGAVGGADDREVFEDGVLADGGAEDGGGEFLSEVEQGLGASADPAFVDPIGAIARIRHQFRQAADGCDRIGPRLFPRNPNDHPIPQGDLLRVPGRQPRHLIKIPNCILNPIIFRVALKQPIRHERSPSFRGKLYQVDSRPVGICNDLSKSLALTGRGI